MEAQNSSIVNLQGENKLNRSKADDEFEAFVCLVSLKSLRKVKTSKSISTRLQSLDRIF